VLGCAAPSERRGARCSSFSASMYAAIPGLSVINVTTKLTTLKGLKISCTLPKPSVYQMAMQLTKMRPPRRQNHT
jgi:hypothetical protein